LEHHAKTLPQALDLLAVRGRPVGRIATSSPPMLIRPDDGVSRKLMQRSMVDLPEPEPPMIATTSPSQARSETPFST
jgi:hypothetical protein